MGGTKRPRAEESTDAGADNIHPSRKRRVEPDEAKAELAPIFNQLREEIPAQRLEALKKLLQNLSTKSGDPSDRLDHAIIRLVKGLCSGAKASRTGFSIALAEVLRLGFASQLRLVGFVDNATALTTPNGNVSGEERRNYLIGRRLAFRAALQSGILAKASENDARYLFDAISELAAEKDWLQDECGAMLHEFLAESEATQLPDEIIRTLVDSWNAKGLLKSPEGVALWLPIKKAFPKVKLPKGIWHHNNPLASQERATLTKILLKNAVDAATLSNGTPQKKAGTRQITPSFAWNIILGYLYREDGGEKFGSFWDDCVAKPMFSASSSAERRSLGLQIFAKAIATAPVALLGDVVHKNIIQCIVDQRAKSDRYLHDAAKVPLNAMAARAKCEPAAAAVLTSQLLTVVPGNLEKLIRSTIETILTAADANGLSEIVGSIVSICRMPGADEDGAAHQKRQMLGSLLLTVVRTRRSEAAQFFAEDNDTTLAHWLQILLRGLTHLAYTTPSEKCLPPLSKSSQDVFRERLTSSLSHLVELSLRQAVAAPALVLETLSESKKSLTDDIDEKRSAALKEARKASKDTAKKAKSEKSSDVTVVLAYQLLLSLGMLQVYNKDEADAVGVLEDIVSCLQNPTGNEDASTMLVELLLSFVSKSSKLFHTLARQVFTAFAPEVTSESLRSMIDILSQKESLAGQQELFAQDGEDDEDGEEDDDEVDEALDVEDDSDVELVNGEIVGAEDADEDDDSGSEDSGDDAEASEGDEDEEAAFDRKLADALGTTGMEEDEDEDGSDMDDDQMMALEGHLTTIFKERKKDANKKQDNKDAKENIVHFKNRVLDLLLIYVKSQYANPIAMDLIHPLATVTRITSNQPTAKKALDVLEQYFDACKKHKSYPHLQKAKPAIKLLTSIFEEMKLGGSKLHATACSRSSLFLAKVLIGMDEKYRRTVDTKYLDLRDEWRKDAKSKIHNSLFSDWHNWSMQR